MRIEVEPQALIAAGRQTAAVGAQLGRLSEALGAALASGIASGTDPAGLNFGLKYSSQAQEFAAAVADSADAFTGVGLLLEATGVNYQNADDASTIGGPGPTARVSGQPGMTLPADVPPGPNGVTVPPPGMWRWVQPFLQAVSLGQFAGFGMAWPSGHSALMGLTAAQWRNFATGFALIQPQLVEIKSVASRQSIPERDAMVSAVTSLGDAISSLADAASTVAQSVSDFASAVQQTQDAIRRLLDRLSLAGLWDTVTGLLTGEGDNILREVARDIGAVLSNLQRQVNGIVELLEELANTVGELASAFQKWIRPVLIEQFGPGLGTALADDITFLTDVHVGALTGLIGTVATVVAQFDPDTWVGLAELGVAVVQDPSILPGIWLNMGKNVLAWDKWSREHPGRAAGEAIFNIGSLLVPGGALTKTGNAGRLVTSAKRALEEGRLPRLDEIKPWEWRAPRLQTAEQVPPFKPAAIPPPPGAPAVVGPTRVGESTPSAPGGRPQIPGAEPGPGQRPPGTQPGQPGDPAGTGARSESTGSSPTRATGEPGTSDGAGRADGLAGAAAAAARADIAHPDLDAPTPTGPSGDTPHVPAAVDPPAGTAGHTPTPPGPEFTRPDGASTGVDTSTPPSAPPASWDSLPTALHDEIVTTEKGSRPDPSEYLPPAYIDKHLEQFDNGAARFIPEGNLNRYGIGQTDGTSFVMPKSEADALIAQTQGDPRAMEQALGLPEGYLDERVVVRVDIGNPREHGLRMPSGNEAGANEYWVPGGRLPDGSSEAIVDGAKVPETDLDVTPVDPN